MYKDFKEGSFWKEKIISNKSNLFIVLFSKFIFNFFNDLNEVKTFNSSEFL